MQIMLKCSISFKVYVECSDFLSKVARLEIAVLVIYELGITVVGTFQAQMGFGLPK